MITSAGIASCLSHCTHTHTHTHTGLHTHTNTHTHTHTHSSADTHTQTHTHTHIHTLRSTHTHTHRLTNTPKKDWNINKSQSNIFFFNFYVSLCVFCVVSIVIVANVSRRCNH